MVDSAPGSQPAIRANSVPTFGQLYPLSEDLFVASNGFVGLGTAAPGAPLDVRMPSNGARFRLFDFGGGGGTQLVALIEGGGGFGGQLRLAGAATGSFVSLSQLTDGTFSIGQPGASIFNMLPNNRVGISTTDPIAQFDVENGVWMDRNALGLNEGAIMTRHDNDLRAAYVGPFSSTEYVIGVHEETGVFIDGGIVHNTVTDVTEVFATVKNFRQTNPVDPETDIVYACVEGPEAAAYVRGTGTLVDGQARIDLPDHFQAVSSGTGVTVHVTPRSAMSRGLAVIERENTHFVVAELMNGSGSYKFDWEIKAVRVGFENYEIVRPKYRSPNRVPEDATPAFVR